MIVEGEKIEKERQRGRERGGGERKRGRGIPLRNGIVVWIIAWPCTNSNTRPQVNLSFSE